MTRSDAMKAIQPLIHMFGGQSAWDEGTIVMWAEQVSRLEDFGSACETTNRLVQTWEQSGRPPFAVWLKTYNSVRHRVLSEQSCRALTSGASDVSADEYLADLVERAGNGDREALSELGDWQRSWFGQQLLSPSTRPVLRVIGEH